MEYRLDELGLVKRGRSKHRPRNAPELYDGDYPFVQTGDIKAAGLHLFNYKQTYNEVGLAQSRLWPKGTLCITIAANIAETSILGIDACFPDSVIGFIADKNKCDTRYIKYLFDYRLKSRSQQLSPGATQDNLSEEKLLSLKFSVPSVPVQESIAEKLGRYDALIENNTRRIAILETKVEQLYKEWFVRRRFPGHGATAPCTALPIGWKVERLGILADISTGKCNREDAEEDGVYPLFDRSQETKRSNEWIKDCEAIIVPGEGTSFMPRYYKGKFNLHQRCYCVAPIMEGIGKYLFYAIMLNRRYFLSVATGATVPSLRQNNFLSMKIIWPGNDLARRFDEVASRLFALKDNLQRQNALLARERDLLLPRLMSGKMAAADARERDQWDRG